jgi:hypothetical protein
MSWPCQDESTKVSVALYQRLAGNGYSRFRKNSSKVQNTDYSEKYLIQIELLKKMVGKTEADFQ